MQQAISIPRVQDGATTSPAQAGRVVLHGSLLVARREVRVIDVWQDALATFAAQAPHLLLLILALVGVHWAVQLTSLSQYKDWLAPAGRIIEMVIQIGLRGAITWVALHGAGGAPITLWRLRQAVGARWAAFLPSSLIFYALFLTATAGLGPLLKGVIGDASTLPYTPQTLIASTRQRIAWDVIEQSIPMFIPNPGLPLLASPDRKPALLFSIDESVPATCDNNELGRGQLACSNAPAQQFAFSRLGYLVTLVAAEILLRFQIAVALRPAGARRQGMLRQLKYWFSPTVRSARIALRHCGSVGAHFWLLHLAVACLGGLFVTLPILSATVAQPWIQPIPLAGALGITWDSPLVDMARSTVTMLIGALLMTFCAIYDARLFMRLTVMPSECPTTALPGNGMKPI